MSSLTSTSTSIVQFDSEVTEVVIVTDRVKLFSASQQRLLADVTSSISNNSSTDVYTCAARAPEHLGHSLLLGSQAGDVRCYDSDRAELRWSTAGSVDGPVASLSCSPVSSAVLVVGRMGAAALLDLSKGTVIKRFQASKHPVSAAKLLADNLAVVAGSGVQIYDVATASRVHKFTGHANPVSTIAATSSGNFICTAADGERHVAVWDATPSKSGKRKHKAAAAQLSLPEPVRQLAVGCPGSVGKESSNDMFHVVAVTQGGAVWLFECSSAASSSVDRLESRQWAQSTAGSGQVLAAGVECADASGVNLVLVSGSTAKPLFQRIRVDKAQKGGVITEFLVHEGQVGGLVEHQGVNGAPSGAQSSKGDGVEGRPAPVAVVDPGAGAVLASKAAGSKRLAEQDLDEDMLEAEQQEGAAYGDGSKPGLANGPTFAERLAALQLQEEGAPQTAQHAKRDTATAAATATPTGPLKADSLSVLLSQALQSGDRGLLERCLTDIVDCHAAVRNEDTIRKTATRLSSSDAALFLKAAVQRLQSAPSRGEQLSNWIRAVLLSHAGSLVAMQGMQPTLSYLYQLIEARLASYQSLLALAGRLDVVLAHAQRAAQGEAEPSTAVDTPLVTVDVGSDDAVEIEDAYAMNGGYTSEDSDDRSDEDDLEGNENGDLFDDDDDADDDLEGEE